MTSPTRTLTQAQIDQYWEDGFLFPIPVISPDKASEWRAALEQLEATWLDNGLPLPLNTYKRVNAQVVMPLAHRIGTDPAILRAVSAVLGPDVML